MAERAIPQTKACRKCGETKPVSEFHKYGKKSKNPVRGLGVVAVCKICRSWEHNAAHAAGVKRKAELLAAGQKECSTCHKVLDLCQFNKSKCTVDGLVHKCRDCSKKINAKWRKDNPDGFKDWLERGDNQKQRSEYMRAWCEENKERRAKEYAEWAKANPHIVNACIARRNAAKLRATPAWADLDAIRAKYEEAAELTRKTGIRHEVDHIYPLQGKHVCGLHVAENLQILTRSQNARKSNKMPEEFGYV